MPYTLTQVTYVYGSPVVFVAGKFKLSATPIDKAVLSALKTVLIRRGIKRTTAGKMFGNNLD